MLQETPIRCIVVRETSVCRNYGGNNLRGLLKPPAYHSTIILRGSRGILNWALIMPRETPDLSDSECKFIAVLAAAGK